MGGGEPGGESGSRLLKPCAANVTAAITMIMYVYKRCSASTHLCLMPASYGAGALASQPVLTNTLQRGLPSQFQGVHTGGPETRRDTATVTTPTCTPSGARHFLSSHQFLIYWIQGKITAIGRGRRGPGERRQDSILGGKNALCLGGPGHHSDKTRGFMKLAN